MLLSTLFLGAFAAYLVGRVVGKIRNDQAGGTAAGLAAIAVLAMAGKNLFSLGGLVAGGRIVLVNAGVLGSTLAVMLRADGLSVFMTGITLSLGLLAVVYSLSYLKHDTGVDKFFPVLLLMLGAMAGLAFADDLFNLFIFYEMMSVASFILVSYRKETWEPIEAGFKYIVLSSVGSFFLLLGIVLVFMYTGELNLSRVAGALTAVPLQPKLLMISLFIAGFGVKAALVPLHTWLPDAHSAAPSSVSALLSAVVIQTGLLAMLRVLLEGFAGLHQTVGLVFVTFGAITMTVGNLTALQQTDLKRMLAYSSIAQMGFILLGLGLGLKYGVSRRPGRGNFPSDDARLRQGPRLPGGGRANRDGRYAGDRPNARSGPQGTPGRGGFCRCRPGVGRRAALCRFYEQIADLRGRVQGRLRARHSSGLSGHCE